PDTYTLSLHDRSSDLVLVADIFGDQPGDFFIHRNIANLVPPHEPDGRSHGTSAAIEYAVIALHVRHLVVMGHSGCGGVRGCHDIDRKSTRLNSSHVKS